MAAGTALATGGARHPLPLWVKVGIYATLLLADLVLTLPDWKLFVVVTAVGAAIVWACHQDLGNILLTLGVVVLMLFLQATRMEGGFKETGTGIKNLLGSPVDAGVEKWPDSVPQAPVQAPVVTAPPTSPPPVVPAAAPAR